MTIIGQDFAFNGVPVGLGEFDAGTADWIHGRITGTLLNGDLLDNGFYIYGDSRLVLVPEPATLSLLTLGGLAVFRRRR